MSDRAISMLVHGHSKVGKSTFTTTAPKPALFLDVEMASRFLPGRKIRWNPMTDAPPVNDGTWDICVVVIDQWAKAEKAYEYLKSRRHPFKSVILDSISELQAKASEDIKGRAQFQTQDWGKLLQRMSFFCRDLRDLTGDYDNTIEAVIITAMSKDYDGTLKPFLQGQISAQIPYWFDITGYLYVDQVPGPDGTPVAMRNLLVDKHPNFEAGNRVPGLPPVIGQPNIADLLDNIFGPSEDAAPVVVEAPSNPTRKKAAVPVPDDGSAPPPPPA